MLMDDVLAQSEQKLEEQAKTQTRDVEQEPEKKASDEGHAHSRFVALIPKPIQKYTGMILTLMASLLFSTCTLIVKILNDPAYGYGFHSYASSFWRYVGVTVPAIPLVLVIEYQHRKHDKESIFDTVWPIGGFRKDKDKWFTIAGLLTRGLLGASSVILRYYALEYLSIGDTSVITYATPVLVTVLAHFCLGEKMGVVPVLAAVATFGGVLLITRPPFLTGKDNYDTENLIGIGLACGSLLCASLIVIITRKIRKVHFSLMTLVFGIIGVAQAFVLTQISNVFQCPTKWDELLYIFGLMFLSFTGQMAIILALTFEQAGPVSMIRSCDVIFGFIFQFIVLHVIPDELSAVGGATVILCISIIGVRKWLSSLPQEDARKKRYKFLLF